MALNNIEITEQLFEAIDAIIFERLKHVEYDYTVTATIINNTLASHNKYTVSTDNNLKFDAYAEDKTYTIGTKVYVRIPHGDYSEQKIITGKYIPIYQE